MRTLVNWAEKHLGTHNGWTFAHFLHVTFRGGGELLPSSRLMSMCRWIGLHFYHWIDYYGAAFLKESLEWGKRKFSGFWGSENSGM